MNKVLIVLILTLLSCSQHRGNYIPGNTVVINGKAYQFAKVEASDDDRVWILLPVDSTTKVPSVMGYYVQDGKTRKLKEVIIVKP